ncbi:MAG: UvrD-helicase domain-containing protein [Pseudomonadota bacterium]
MNPDGTGRPGDWEARRTALDPTRSFIVQAPAGAGKTGLLTQRFLRLLAGVAEPEEILAITFTRKAAAEMRNRITSALADAAAGRLPEDAYDAANLELATAALEQSNSRGWDLQRHPGRLQVRTIDSFCHRLARRLPLLSEQGGATAPMDNAQELYRLAARRTLAMLDDREAGDSVRSLLEHLDGQFPRAESLLAAMLGQRDQWLRHLAGDGRHLQRAALEASLAQMVQAFVKRAADSLPASRFDTLWRLARFARAHLPGDKNDTPLGHWDGEVPDPITDPSAWQAAAALLLTNGGELRKPRGVNRGMGFPAPGKDTALQRAKTDMQELLTVLAESGEFIDALAEVADLPETLYTEDQWTLLSRLPELLKIAYAQLKLIFSERGTTDHLEISHGAGMALGSEGQPTDLALYLEYRLHHLLVDEFQDTSKSQFDLFRQLTAAWQPGDGHSFFAVGDPMQSIYRFRQAEVSLFLEAREQGLGSLPLSPLTLTANFRSEAPLVGWVNRAFPHVMPRHDDRDRGAVSYAPFEASRKPGDSDPKSVHIHALVDTDAATESARVAELIRQSLDDGLKQVVVLGRSRSHLRDVSVALRRAGISYQAVEVQPLGRELAVRELRALTRALLLPWDRAAWLAVLRAPWCGLTLKQLAALAADSRHRPLLAAISSAVHNTELDGDALNRLQRTGEILSAAVRSRRRRSLRESVESVWMNLGGPACLRTPGDHEAAQGFLSLLDELDDAGDMPLLQRLDDALEQLYAPPDPQGDERVQLMTIHKAKGLEFDAVILPGLGRVPRGNERQLLQWLEWEGSDGTSHFVLAPIASREQGSDALEQLLRRTEKAKQELEATRLLYVAATRARERLHLVGRLKPVDDPDRLKPPTGSLLNCLWPVLSGHFHTALERYHEVSEHTEKEPEPSAPPRLLRATAPWQPPDLNDPLPLLPVPGEQTRRPEYEWAGSSARHIGTVIHAYLERISKDGLENWSRERIGSSHRDIRGQLEALGVGQDAIDAATEKVAQGLRNSLKDERARWILSGHAESRSEYPVTALIEGRPTNMVIDRTFIDADGTRWIIDYKTGSHEGGSHDNFLRQEEDRYRDQLEGYRKAMRRLDPGRKVRLGLYFPLLMAWRELPA